MMKFKVVEYGDADTEFVEDYFIDDAFVDRVISGDEGEVCTDGAEAARLMFEMVAQALDAKVECFVKEEDAEGNEVLKPKKWSY